MTEQDMAHLVDVVTAELNKREMVLADPTTLLRLQAERIVRTILTSLEASRTDPDAVSAEDRGRWDGPLWMGYVDDATTAAAAIEASWSDMPTIWCDPAGKGYPCMERPMTPAEAKETIDRLSARVAELEASRTPEGMVLVPREPTEAMIEAGFVAIERSDLVNYQDDDPKYRWGAEWEYSARDAWKAMLSAILNEGEQ